MGREARARRARRYAGAGGGAARGLVGARPDAGGTLLVGEFRAGATIETTRRCRICLCAEDDRCWEARQVPHPLAPSIAIETKTFCRWVGPDLCSFCAADGGPPHVIGAGFGPECYSTLLDRFGQPILLSKFLPK